MPGVDASETTYLLDQETREGGRGTHSNLWKKIFDPLERESAADRLSFRSESIDSDISSIQSFSSLQQGKDWLQSFEAYLRNIDYYCDNHTTRRKCQICISHETIFSKFLRK